VAAIRLQLDNARRALQLGQREQNNTNNSGNADPSPVIIAGTVLDHSPSSPTAPTPAPSFED
jgi:hypothetical protein